jgi:hypothetical protein
MFSEFEIAVGTQANNQASCNKNSIINLNYRWGIQDVLI